MSAPVRPYWPHSDTEASAEHDDGKQDCARGEWCDGREIVTENRVRTVIPARAYRPYCPKCESHIGLCLDDQANGLAALYVRLAAEIGEARQAEIMIKMPFGPAVPLSEAIDTHMRSMGEILCSWEERCRDTDNLSALGPAGERPQDSLDDVERSIRILSPRLTMLLGFAPLEMLRVLPPWAVPEGAEILDTDGFMVKTIIPLGGQHAGYEVLDLHYRARRLLMETNPPQPLLPDFRCRVCEQKSLRKASPPWAEGGVWYWSRCDNCGDEMTREDYDTNAKRWIAFERAHLARPVLGLAQVA